MSLNDKLDGLRATMNSEAAAAYEEILQRFRAADLAKAALRPGDAMPRFILPNAEGQLVSSDELLSRGHLVLTFYRGNWCSYCAEALRALDAMVQDLSSRTSLSLAALSPETGGRATRFKARHELQCQVLVDVDNALAAQFGVVIRLPRRYQKLLGERGIEPAMIHGGEGWLIPVASTFVVSDEGKVLHAELHVDHTHRTELKNVPFIIKNLSSSC